MVQAFLILIIVGAGAQSVGAVYLYRSGRWRSLTEVAALLALDIVLVATAVTIWITHAIGPYVGAIAVLNVFMWILVGRHINRRISSEAQRRRR